MGVIRRPAAYFMRESARPTCARLCNSICFTSARSSLLAHLLGMIAACHAILQHAHVARRDCVGGVAGRDAVSDAHAVSVPRPQQVRRLRRRAPRRERTAALARASAGMGHAASSAVRAHDELGHSLVHSLTHLGGMPFLPGNTVRTLVNGEATFAAIFDAIEKCAHYVIVQFFIVRDDALGEMLKEALIAKAAARRARLFSVRQHRQLRSAASLCGGAARGRRRDASVRDQPTLRQPLAAQLPQSPQDRRRSTANARLSVDTTSASNISAQAAAFAVARHAYRGARTGGRQHPVRLHRRLALGDPAVARIRACRRSRPPTEGMHCLVMPSGPADRRRPVRCSSSRRSTRRATRIWITTPYLVPDEAVLSALRLAVLRGVDVRILIPSRRDHRVVFAASTLYAYDSVRAGIRIFRYRPGFLHQKVVLIDDVAAAIGSANLDNRSFRLNFEIMVLTVDRGFAAGGRCDADERLRRIASKSIATNIKPSAALAPIRASRCMWRGCSRRIL
jgi:cardiolipin synthase